MDRHLRAFLAVARIGNLTAAAVKIGLTQPALTKTIRRLEHDLGAELFERTARGMILTQVGATFFARAQAIETHYMQALEEVKAVTAGDLAQFRLGAGAAYHMTIAPDLVKRLSAEFPQTSFILDFDVAGVALPKLVKGELDLVLGAFHNIPPEGIETREVLKVEVTAYCWREDPLAKAGIVAPAALKDRRWIIYKRDRLIAQRLEAYCAEHLLPRPKVAMEVDALGSTFRIVNGSRFLTLAPTSLQDVAADAGLARLTMQHPIWKFASGAWFRQSSREYPIMRRVLEILPELTRASGGEGHSDRL